MIVETQVYIRRRLLPRWLVRLFFIEAVIKTSSPYYPRIGEQLRVQPVEVACPECSGRVTL